MRPISPAVTSFSTETWVLLVLVGGAGLTAILHTLARTFNEERKVHDLKVRVFELRKSYAKRLAEISGREAEFVDDSQVTLVDEPAKPSA